MPTPSAPARGAAGNGQGADAIVIHYRTDSLTDGLLAALRALPRSSVRSVVVVDNASPVPYALPRAAPPEPRGRPERLVRLERGAGFAGAVAAGRAVIDGPWLAILNNDLELPADPFPALLARLRAEPGLGVVGPRLEFPDGRFQLSWGDDLGLAEELRDRRRQAQMRAGGGRDLARRESQSRTARTVDWVSGAMLVARAEAYDAVGGLDPGFVFYYEDVDFCRRVRAAGWSVGYEPAARVVHLLGATRSPAGPPVAVPEEVLMGRELGQVRYYRRWRSRPETAVVKALLAGRLLARPGDLREPWRRRLLARIARA